MQKIKNVVFLSWMMLPFYLTTFSYEIRLLHAWAWDSDFALCLTLVSVYLITLAYFSTQIEQFLIAKTKLNNSLFHGLLLSITLILASFIFVEHFDLLKKFTFVWCWSGLLFSLSKILKPESLSIQKNQQFSRMDNYYSRYNLSREELLRSKVTSAPSLSMTNGYGATLMASYPIEPEKNIYIKAHIYCLFFFPVYIFKYYLVVDSHPTYRFLSVVDRESMSKIEPSRIKRYMNVYPKGFFKVISILVILIIMTWLREKT